LSSALYFLPAVDVIEQLGSQRPAAHPRLPRCCTHPAAGTDFSGFNQSAWRGVLWVDEKFLAEEFGAAVDEGLPRRWRSE